MVWSGKKRAKRARRLQEGDIEWGVVCSGIRHHITLRANGKLILHDHPKLRAEQALVALGSPIPRCLDILSMWAFRRQLGPTVSWAQQRWSGHLGIPSNIVERHTETVTLANTRWNEMQQRTHREERTWAMMGERRLHWKQRMRWAATMIIEQTNYWNRHDLKAPFVVPSVEIWVGRQPSIRGYLEKERNMHNPEGHLLLFLFVQVTPAWWRLFQRDEALVDGCVVVQELAASRHKIPRRIVMAGRQNAQGEVKAERAYLMTDATGETHLVWCRKAST